MVLPESVRQALNRNNIELAAEIISDPAMPSGIFVPLRINRDINGKQNPSYRTLNALKNELAAAGFIAEFLLIDLESKSVEEGLRASLLSTFPDLIRNSFVTTKSSVAHIWIDNKRTILDVEQPLVESFIAKYIEAVSLQGFEIYFISEETIPNNTEILFVIKRSSPVGCEQLCALLESGGFSVPSLDWINRKFDALRKAGLLIRRSDRLYVLTAEGLHRLGTRKNRNSPDLSRLLALARQGR